MSRRAAKLSLARLQTAAIVLAIIAGTAVWAENGLYVEYYKDTPSEWGAFGSDPYSPQPFMWGTDPNIDFIFGNNELQHFSARWQGYLYVPASKAGSIRFKMVTDDGARLKLDGTTVMDFWRLQAHQTIGTPSDECTHEADVNLTEGYHPIVFEYFEWEGGDGDPDPCRLYWDGQIIPEANLFTGNPSGLDITDVSHGPSPFHPHQGEVCDINYTITADANVSVTILTTEGDIVRYLINETPQSAGAHTVTWNGQNGFQQYVPDGTYLYTIEAENATDYAVYCPDRYEDVELTDFWANSPFTPPEETCDIHETLSDEAHVRVRIGIEGGPLLRTLVDWDYRPAGESVEEWDGRDESGNLVPPNEYLICIWADGVVPNGIIVEGPVNE